MVRTFFLLLPVIADYETVTGLAQVAFRLGVVNASILGCTGILLGLRDWRTKRR